MWTELYSRSPFGAQNLNCCKRCGGPGSAGWYSGFDQSAHLARAKGAAGVNYVAQHGHAAAVVVAEPVLVAPWVDGVIRGESLQTHHLTGKADGP